MPPAAAFSSAASTPNPFSYRLFLRPWRGRSRSAAICAPRLQSCQRLAECSCARNAQHHEADEDAPWLSFVLSSSSGHCGRSRRHFQIFHCFTASNRPSAWQMPGIDLPCHVDTGDSSAPVCALFQRAFPASGAADTRPSSRSRSRRSDVLLFAENRSTRSRHSSARGHSHPSPVLIIACRAHQGSPVTIRS